MAGADRTQSDDLIDWAALAETLPSAGLFAVVRHVEAMRPDWPRLGTAKLPARNILDLAQEPTMGFVAGTLARIDQRHGRKQLRGFWLGLTGPMGPLPSHMTEYALHERRYAKQFPYNDWLDVLAGRMLQLFYRAWANSQPAALADRGDEDGFAAMLGALTGATDGARPADAFFARARSHYAPVFAGSRSAVAIEDALTHLLGQPVRVEEYLPRWRNFETEDCSRLGRQFCVLGDDVMLGQKVYSASDAFRVIIRAEDFRAYQSLLPGGSRFAVAAEAINAFKPTHLEWELTVEIAASEAPRARLDGMTRLGWSGWMLRGTPRHEARRHRGKPKPPVDAPVRADTRLRSSSIKKGNTAT